MAMKKGRCNVLGFTLVFMLLILGSMVGCNQEDDSSVCECPNGTNHYPNDCTCGADDCNCINEVPESPEFRETTINLTINNFGLCTATVKGTLTSSQWDGLATRIETILQDSYNVADRSQRGAFAGIFGEKKAVIVVVKDATFSQWSVSNRYSVYLDFDYLNGQPDEALVTSFIDIIVEMGEAPEPR